ncbi:hypothetical protein HpBT060_15230 [Helicobacter pylori]
MIITKVGKRCSVGLGDKVEVRECDKRQSNYNLIYEANPLYVISNGTLKLADDYDKMRNS